MNPHDHRVTHRISKSIDTKKDQKVHNINIHNYALGDEQKKLIMEGLIVYIYKQPDTYIIHTSVSKCSVIVVNGLQRDRLA